MTSETRDFTITPKVVPIMIPTAISITFPRMANFLNSFHILYPFLSGYLLNHETVV